MATTEPKMPDGFKRLPDEQRKTSEGIERLITLISQSNSVNKKQMGEMVKGYRSEINKIVKEQDKTQKEVVFYVSELRKAGVDDKEIAAYIEKNIKLNSGDKKMTETMKQMQDALQEMVKTTEFKTEEDKVLAEKQAKTLDKYFKEEKKSKAKKGISKKLDTAKEETGSALKESLAKSLGVGFQTLAVQMHLLLRAHMLL